MFPALRGALLALGFLASGRTPASAQSLTIGGEDAIGGVIGRVGSGLVVAPGIAVFADIAEQRLYIANARTGRVGTLGRRGRGPREFDGITALFAISTTQFAVIDGGNRRLAVLRLAGDSADFDRLASTDVIGRNACTIGATVYLQGVPQFGPVGAYAFDGRALTPLRRLGRPIAFETDPRHEMVTAFHNIGSVGCDAERQQVAWAPAQRGALQIIDLQTATDTTIRFTDFVGVVYTPIPNGVRNSVPAAGFMEVIEGVLALEDAWLVRGEQQRPRRAPGPGNGMWTRLVDARGTTNRRVDSPQWAPLARGHGWILCVNGPEDEVAVRLELEGTRPCGARP